MPVNSPDSQNQYWSTTPRFRCSWRLQRSQAGRGGVAPEDRGRRRCPAAPRWPRTPPRDTSEQREDADRGPPADETKRWDEPQRREPPAGPLWGSSATAIACPSPRRCHEDPSLGSSSARRQVRAVSMSSGRSPNGESLLGYPVQLAICSVTGRSVAASDPQRPGQCGAPAGRGSGSWHGWQIPATLLDELAVRRRSSGRRAARPGYGRGARARVHAVAGAVTEAVVAEHRLAGRVKYGDVGISTGHQRALRAGSGRRRGPGSPRLPAPACRWAPPGRSPSDSSSGSRAPMPGQPVRIALACRRDTPEHGRANLAMVGPDSVDRPVRERRPQCLAQCAAGPQRRSDEVPPGAGPA